MCVLPPCLLSYHVALKDTLLPRERYPVPAWESLFEFHHVGLYIWGESPMDIGAFPEAVIDALDLCLYRV